MAQSALVFVHSYNSMAHNWHDVVFGSRAQPGRLRKAISVARELNASVIADDSFDRPNQRLYRRLGIENLGLAKTTRDEVRNFLKRAPRDARKVFVSSPDHLPRVTRDALALNAQNTMFAASDTAYTPSGAAGVSVHEGAA